MHCWKGNLSEIQILFRYLKNISILPLYKHFSRNGSEMDQELLSKKISDFQRMKILYIALQHVIWRFRINHYFREIFRFHDFMNALMISQDLYLSIKSQVVTHLKSPDHVLQSFI